MFFLDVEIKRDMEDGYIDLGDLGIYMYVVDAITIYCFFVVVEVILNSGVFYLKFRRRKGYF